MQGLRALVERLGGKSGKKVVLLDTREELCVYLAGHPYTRRDIEMPTASLHHAGIHWRELQRLEEWLLEDVRLSSGNWVEENAHRVLVHKEVPVRCPLAPAVTCRHIIILCHAFFRCKDDRIVGFRKQP